MADQSIPMLSRAALATGDLIYRAASSTWQRLGIGATDTIFSVASGIPAWQSLATLFANAFSNTRGALLRRGSSAWEAFTGSQGGVLIRDANDATWLAKPSVPSLLYHAGTTSNPAWKLHTQAGLTSTTACAANTTPADTLSVTLGAGTYYFELDFCVAILATPDFRFDFNHTGSITLFAAWGQQYSTAAYIGDIAHYTTIGADQDTTVSSDIDNYISVNGCIVTSSGGTFSWRTGRVGASSNSSIRAGATLRVYEAF